MRAQRKGSGPIDRAALRVLSVPLFVKTLGIVVIAVAVLGGILLVEARASLSRNLRLLLKQRTVFQAEYLAANLARPLATHDAVAVTQILARTRETFSDIRYVIVRDSEGEVAYHTFGGSVPRDFVSPPASGFPEGASFRVLHAGPEGLIFEAVHTILRGYAGSVQIGMRETMVSREVSAVTASILRGAAISLAIGVALAVALTLLLTRPVQELRDAADRIRGGDFGTRAQVFSGDEVGCLAVAFNEMAGSLQRYRGEVREDERVRLALIERIVGSNEEERKVISRELHDQFGQSLLALLMDMRSSAREGVRDRAVCQRHEQAIEHLIDELGRITRGMHPMILDDYGLPSALDSYARETIELSGLDVACKCNIADGHQRLPGPVEVTLFRIAQEAVTNVVRHAEASHVSILLLGSPQETALLIEDDGKGFDLARVQGDRGLGLVGMRERVSLVGGVLDIDSDVGGGTTIRARIPKERSDHDADDDRDS